MNAATARTDEPTRVEKMGLVSIPASWDRAFEETLRCTDFRGICYTTAGRARQLYEDTSITDHLAIVEHIGLASKLAAHTQYDFILMAGLGRSQLDDILEIAREIHAAGRSIPPLYVDGVIHPEVTELLPLFAPSMDLKQFIELGMERG